MDDPVSSRSPLTIVTAAAVLLLLTATTVTAHAPRASAAGLTPVPDFGADPGTLSLYTYVPDDLAEGAPLVVLLHGCSQDADTYHAHSGWAEQADESGFALAYAEQDSTNNLQACFNWFEPGDTARDSGEAASVRSMVDHTLDTHGLDPGRVFVSGLSAGGAMAGELLAAYPDVFAGGDVVAGIPVGCAESLVDATTCMSFGKDRTPEQWGDEVRAEYDGDTSWPRVAVWHGSSDTTVVPTNGDASVDQWTDVHGLSGGPDETAELPGGTTAEYYGGSADGATVAHFTVEGLGHGTPVAPDEGCGTTGPFFPDSVCASAYTAQFWGIA
ncbi:extracellular catalytic domain type 1 short-chain-length polyhydroxyalkanoate depolymerase [Nocardiopsis kunsanensis]|uniref:extracellular catalytic domain type 1 short-chain-length polyhydroxyalkanoate depolymerase n=1 Tax=Nocardiopsis kunsanensis TaxID=141693 RepID=UPI00037EE564|nr:PHB depolymerase family esterase [Nocardiopsis kunsanensis]